MSRSVQWKHYDWFKLIWVECSDAKGSRITLTCRFGYAGYWNLPCGVMRIFSLRKLIARGHKVQYINQLRDLLRGGVDGGYGWQSYFNRALFLSLSIVCAGWTCRWRTGHTHTHALLVKQRVGALMLCVWTEWCLFSTGAGQPYPVWPLITGRHPHLVSLPARLKGPSVWCLLGEGVTVWDTHTWHTCVNARAHIHTHNATFTHCPNPDQYQHLHFRRGSFPWERTCTDLVLCVCVCVCVKHSYERSVLSTVYFAYIRQPVNQLFLWWWWCALTCVVFVCLSLFQPYPWARVYI